MILPEGPYLDRLADPRLREHVRLTESGCWEWTRSRTEAGYGRISWLGHVERVHRVVASLTLDLDLASNAVVCHRCDNPPCFNPDHLFIGTLSDNTQDMIAKGRGYPGPPKSESCAKGHPLSGDNLMKSGRCRACHADAGGSPYYSHPYVEEFSLFAPGVLPRKVAYWRAFAAVNADGTAREVRAGETLVVNREEGWTGIDPDIPGRRPTVAVHEVRWNHESPVMYRDIRVVASSEQAAIKAASDTVARLRAEAIERESLKPKPGQKPNRGRR